MGSAIEDAIWVPREYYTTGPRDVAWMREWCVHTEGDFAGDPFNVTEPQEEIINRIFEQERTRDGSGWQNRYQRVLLGMASGSGKTELVAALGHRQMAKRRSPIIPIAAASKDQAGELFGAAKFMCEDPAYPLYKTSLAGADRITLRGRPGRMYRVSAMEGTNEGKRPSDFFADELHAWPETRNTYQVISKGTAKRRDSLQVAISTAGFNLDTICGRLYSHGLRVLAGEIEDPHFLMIWIEAPKEAGIDDFSRYHEWHIGVAGGFLTVENLIEQRRELHEALFRRYFRNEWVEAESAWLPDGAWDECLVDPGTLVFDVVDDGRGAHGGWDASTNRDSTGVGWARWATDAGGRRRLFVDGKAWERPINPLTAKAEAGWRIPREDVKTFVREKRVEYALTTVQYDRMFITWTVEDMEAEGLPMREFAQSGAKFSEASQELYNMIIDGTLAHAGNPQVARHIRNTVARQVRSGSGAWRLEKGRQRRPMDLTVAIAMAVWGANHAEETDAAVEVHVA